MPAYGLIEAGPATLTAVRILAIRFPWRLS
jgi:hypothetical protein